MKICSEQAMKDFGARLMKVCNSAGVITLRGDLGTGKTTIVRGALQACGITSGVRSPTYTLIEFYPLKDLSVAHLDLYRLSDAEELEYLGYRDYLQSDTLCLIEWPERAEGYLQDIGLQISITYAGECRELEIQAFNPWGDKIQSKLKLT